MTFCKICGITNVEDACVAVDAGADLVGLILTPKSPRYVTTSTAASIVRAVRTTYGRRTPRFVGVLVDEPEAQIPALMDAIGLDLAQLHGSEPPEWVRRLAPRAFKAIRPSTLEQARAGLDTYRGTVPDDPRLPQLLVDAYHPEKLGGTGHTADPGLARWLAERVRLLLAGGLTAESVAGAVEQIRPWGVDVSSGVELRPGVKDPTKVRAFVQAVRDADAALAEPRTADHESATRDEQ
jgi:phosphoribosylanthranilate isomerase